MIKKQTRLAEVPAGTTFEAWGRKFVVLEQSQSGERTFVLSADTVTDMPFRENNTAAVAKNDFRDSDIREWLNGDFLAELYEDGAKETDILDFEMDLKCTMGQHEYGKCEVKVGLLSLEEYGEYYDIIPLIDEIWWLSTPWKTPLRSPNTYNTTYVFYVSTNGDRSSSNCSSSYGVRPALTLNPLLLVSWESNDEEETEKDEYDERHKLSEYTLDELMDEIKRRFEEERDA